nr:hypothetical protein [Kibdelosporangium phytohabitans]
MGWHSAGRLRLLLDDGSGVPPCWVAWRDQAGTAYSLGMWSPELSGESHVIRIAGTQFTQASVFSGYRNAAGHAPVGFRGTLVAPSVVKPAPSEPVVLQDVPVGTPCLPSVESVPLIRTDFGNDEAWTAAVREVTEVRTLPNGDIFSASVDVVDDKRFSGLTATQLCQLAPPGAGWSLPLVADWITMMEPEHPVLVVDLDEDSLGRTFRATPYAVHEIEPNLSLANVDWESFEYSADDDGVVRPSFS